MPKGGVGPQGRSGKRKKKIVPPQKKQKTKETPESGTSKKFFRRSRSTSSNRDDPKFSGYRVIDFDYFFTQITENLRCECGKTMMVTEQSVRGLYSTFQFSCSECSKSFVVNSCKQVGKSSNAPEINRRFVYAMRCLGHGRAGLETFCEVMDMPQPVQQTSYERIKGHILEAQKTVAETSMCAAAQAEIEEAGSRDITVSGDGTWGTRGHTAENGVTSIMGESTGLVIDVEILSKACRGCALYKGPKDTIEYDQWKENHATSCTLNHVGSSGQMEVEAAKKMFARSEEKRGVRYVKYIGDGDTKTFLAIAAMKPYGDDVSVEKEECVQHVQKRMGSRLRKRVSEGKKLSDNKGFGGKGRLTGKAIDQISGLYGKCIRDFPDSVADMHKSIWALFKHKRSTDEDPDHSDCDIKWCKYLQAEKAGNLSSYKHKNGVAPVCMDGVKDIFEALTDPKLLGRCLGAHSQNRNENFNSLIWKFAPKTSFNGLETIQSATYEAVIILNEGHRGRLEVMRKLNLIPGMHAKHASVAADNKRLSSSNRKTEDATQKSRTSRRQEAAAKEARHDQAGPSYAPGQF